MDPKGAESLNGGHFRGNVWRTHPRVEPGNIQYPELDKIRTRQGASCLSKKTRDVNP
jgi:hypothetical protein